MTKINKTARVVNGIIVAGIITAFFRLGARRRNSAPLHDLRRTAAPNRLSNLFIVRLFQTKAASGLTFLASAGPTTQVYGVAMTGLVLLAAASIGANSHLPF